MSEQEDGFIGSKLKLIPSSRLIYSTPNQLLLLAKRRIIQLDTVRQTLAYAPIEDQKIIHATYHSLLAVYFLLTEKHILAVNQAGELIKKMYIESLQGIKFIFMVGLEDGYKGSPNYREDLLVYVKGDHLYQTKTTVFNERQMIKNKSICDISLTVESPLLLQSPQFIEKQKHLPHCSLLIIWDNSETYIFKTPNLVDEHVERLYIYNKISKRENQSLDYAVSMSDKLMAVAFQSGVVKIFYLDHSKKYLADLKGHQAACTTLFIGSKNTHLLYSSGLDSTVRIWNMRDYQQVYMLQLDIISKQCVFIDERLLFMRSEELKQKSYVCELNTNLLQPIVNDNISGHLLKMRSTKEWCISIYSNNLVQFFSVSSQSLSNQKVEYPLQYGTVVDVFNLGRGKYVVTFHKGFSLIEFNKQDIKAQNFQLKKLVYNESILRKKQNNDNFIQLIHQKLLGTFLFNVISDWKNIPTAIKVTYVYFHQNDQLPLWDGHTSKKRDDFSTITYCVIGTVKGQIMFLDISNRSHYSTKVHFHTDSVELIRQIIVDQKNNFFFLSMSTDKQIVIWKLTHKEPPIALVNLKHNKQITYFEVFANYIVIGQKDGQFSILKLIVNNQGEIRSLKAHSIGGHLRAVICGDYMKYNECDLFLSGGQDSVIKIWKGVQKIIIFQLKLFGIVSTINFLHDRLNLIVCHNQQISIIRQEKLKSLKKAEKVLIDSRMQIDLQNLVEQINLRVFFFKEPMSPLITFRRNSHLMRTNTKIFNLQRKLTKFQDIEHSLMSFEKEISQQVNQTMITKPVSQPRFQSTDKKIKRFHIYTNDRYADTGMKASQDLANPNIMLPRINTKAKVATKTKFRFQQSSDFLSDREFKVKSFSIAATKKL